MIHVLIMGVMVSVITAALISVVTLQYRATARFQGSTAGKKQDEELLATVLSQWTNGADNACTNTAATADFPALTCATTNAGLTCANKNPCKCTNGTYAVETTTGGPNSSCNLTISGIAFQ